MTRKGGGRMTVAADMDQGRHISRSTLRKVTWRLVPFMMLCYFINYTDRVDVAYAALRMNADIGLSAAMYGFGAGVFFIGYFMFEVPSNLILQRVGARVWIARIAITWGCCAGATAFVHSPTSFYVVRFVLGVTEAGFFPGMLLYLTYWYPRAQRAWVTSLFFASVPLSTVVGAPLSTLILQHVVIGPLNGWRSLFLIEGVPAVLAGLVALVVLTDGPVKARWLSGEQRCWLLEALASEQIAVRRRYPVNARTAVRVAGDFRAGLLVVSAVMAAAAFLAYAVGHTTEPAIAVGRPDRRKQSAIDPATRRGL
jgi:MFS transporter, ACS family, tartrate transporter